MMETTKADNELGNLEKTLFSAFKYVSDAVIRSKSGLVGFCSEIDRFLTITLGININKEITMEQANSLFEYFPNLKTMPFNLLEKLFFLIKDIRNVSAHLFLSSELTVDIELLKFLSKIVEPLYKVEVDGKLTIYGCAYVLSFICQKYQTWPFITNYFNKDICGFKSNELSKIQTEINKHCQSYCGIAYPLYPENHPIPKGELIYLNDLIKSTLNKIFFKLEFILSKGVMARTNDNRSFIHILKHSKTGFSNKLINKLNSIRNLWFHGTMIYDKIKDDYIEEFNLKTISDTLVELLEECEIDGRRYKVIIDAIRSMGFQLYDFCSLRLVEVTYKLLDRKLFDETKIEERITNSVKAFTRLIKTNEYGFLEAAYNLAPNAHKYVVAAAKFTDIFPRSIRTSNLKIYKINSMNGIKINDIVTKETEVYICLLVNGNNEPLYKNHELNKICEKDVYELEAILDSQIGKSHTIYNVII